MSMTMEMEPQTTSGLPALIGNGNSSMAVELARAEIDQQISTARHYPRSIQRAVQNITSLATLDADTAAECVFALPRGGKPIKGPSVRLAEIIASQWGNCRVAARVVHVDRIEKYVEAEGVFHDLESNSASTARVRRRIVDKNGRLFNDDMIVVTGNAACSIAKRNAVLAGVPKAVWRRAYEQSEAVIAGDVKTLAERREKAIKAFAAFGVKPAQIFDVLDVKGEADISLEHIGTLLAMHNALKSGEATVEEMFPAKGAEKPQAPTGKDAMDAFAAKPKSEPAVSQATPHDPQTGEVIEAAPADPFDWAKYVELTAADIATAATIEALNEDWTAIKERMDERGAPQDARDALTRAYLERAKALKGGRK
jgi:hypothetical protein